MKLNKAFTLIELLIVIIIIGILSTLLFRTLADMLTANARIQQEKIMTQELMTIQTTINNISEHYPIIDTIHYE
jgi:prepilin-type N-terminal cleavage/methylation domain-containing protein